MGNKVRERDRQRYPVTAAGQRGSARLSLSSQPWIFELPTRQRMLSRAQLLHPLISKYCHLTSWAYELHHKIVTGPCLKPGPWQPCIYCVRRSTCMPFSSTSILPSLLIPWQIFRPHPRVTVRSAKKILAFSKLWILDDWTLQWDPKASMSGSQQKPVSSAC